MKNVTFSKEDHSEAMVEFEQPSSAEAAARKLNRTKLNDRTIDVRPLLARNAPATRPAPAPAPAAQKAAKRVKVKDEPVAVKEEPAVPVRSTGRGGARRQPALESDDESEDSEDLVLDDDDDSDDESEGGQAVAGGPAADSDSETDDDAPVRAPVAVKEEAPPKPEKTKPKLVLHKPKPKPAPKPEKVEPVAVKEEDDDEEEEEEGGEGKERQWYKSYFIKDTNGKEHIVTDLHDFCNKVPRLPLRKRLSASGSCANC